LNLRRGNIGRIERAGGFFCRLRPGVVDAILHAIAPVARGSARDVGQFCDGLASSLAEEFCFADASSFGRAFKRAFGCSRGEARSAALAGLAPAMRQRRAPPEGSGFDGLLSRL
jgi:AraC-like DNA-binding protein